MLFWVQLLATIQPRGDLVASATTSCGQFLNSNGKPISKPPFSTLEEFYAFLEAPFRPNDPFYQLPEVDIGFQKFPRDPAVQSTHFFSLDGRGLGYFVLIKNGQTWRSSAAKNSFDVQSDPTWILSALGPKLSSYLGFRLLTPSIMVAPNAELFNERIALLNKRLVEHGFEPILVHWVSKMSATLLPPQQQAFFPQMGYAEIYMRLFYSGFISPLEEKKIIHDVAHHSLEILLTKNQMKSFFKRLETVIHFADALRTTLRSQLDKRSLLIDEGNHELIIELLFQVMIRNKDNLSGQIPVRLLNYQKTPPQDIKKSHYRLADFHLGPEMGDGYRDGLSFYTKTNYSVFQWFNALLRNYLPKLILLPNTPHANGRDEKGMRLIMQYAEKKFPSPLAQMQNKSMILVGDLHEALYIFARDGRLKEEILVQYGGDLEVVNGIASPEHPEVSFQRRVDEMNSVLPD